MIVGIITAHSAEGIEPQLQALSPHIRLVELRLDFWPTLDLDRLQHLLRQSPVPLILTLRPTAHGGHYQGNEAERLACLQKLAALSPAYLDLEHTVASDFIRELKQQYPSVQLIRSYHNFSETPEDLSAVLASLQHPDIDVYKVVTLANAASDGLRMLHFVKAEAQKQPLVAHCMGEQGLPTRVAGKIFGSIWQYAEVTGGNRAAPDCPDVKTLAEIYRVPQLNHDTTIYALLGDPVAHSIGHVYHNQAFGVSGKNAVYIKIKLTADEVSEFFQLLHELPFAGFSVTTPLKEEVQPHMAAIDPYAVAIGAVNTIKIEPDGCYATNTDGLGALEAIEELHPVAEDHVLLIGAGGAAKAIAVEARVRGAKLTILNRSLERAERLAEQLAATAYDFSSFVGADLPKFSVIINAAPITIESEQVIAAVLQPLLHAGVVFMNVDYSNQNSALVDLVTSSGCMIVQATEMFNKQAELQQQYWQ